MPVRSWGIVGDIIIRFQPNPNLNLVVQFHDTAVHEGGADGRDFDGVVGVHLAIPRRYFSLLDLDDGVSLCFGAAIGAEPDALKVLNIFFNLC